MVFSDPRRTPLLGLPSFLPGTTSPGPSPPEGLSVGPPSRTKPLPPGMLAPSDSQGCPPPISVLKGMERFIGPNEKGLLSTVSGGWETRDPYCTMDFRARRVVKATFPRAVRWRTWLMESGCGWPCPPHYLAHLAPPSSMAAKDLPKWLLSIWSLVFPSRLGWTPYLEGLMGVGRANGDRVSLHTGSVVCVSTYMCMYF